jgi:TetR/AcrR family tetracycline transcriptional repressor
MLLDERVDTAPRRRRARGSLSRHEILDAALHVVETRGLRLLSMPTLARQLGSGATSIYKYFPSKEALVEALATQVVQDIRQRLPPIGVRKWDVELFGYFSSFRELLATHRAYLELVAYGPAAFVHLALTEDARRRLDDGLDLLATAGLDRRAAIEAFTACLNYTRGFVLLASRATVPGRPGSAWDADLRIIDVFDADQFSHGLRLLIAGIRAEAT